MTKFFMHVVVSFLILSAQYCFAQPGDLLFEWEPVQRITFDSVSSGPPRIQAEGSNVFLCWQTEGTWYRAGKSFFARSIDIGISWQQPSVLTDTFPPFYSNNRFAISGNYVYFKTWNNLITPDSSTLGIWFLRSTDFGVTWDSGHIIGGWGKEAWSIAAEKNHIVINYEIRRQTVEQGFAHSSDYGVTWNFFNGRLATNESPEIILKGGVLYETREGAVNDAAEVLFSYSTDYGETWASERFISSTDSLVSDESYICADSVGNVYVTWRDAKYGSSTGFGATIMLRRSTDYGITWLPEQIVSDTPSGLFPKLTAHKNIVAVVWQTETNEGDSTIYSIHSRISLDRGNTWRMEYQLTENSSNISYEPDVAITEEHIHVAWSVDVNLISRVMYRRGRILPEGVTDSGNIISANVALDQNYPNPFNSLTVIKYRLPVTSYVSLKVYTMLGNEVAILVNENQHPGTYSLQWNAQEFVSGMYVAVLQCDEQFFMRKIMVIK